MSFIKRLNTKHILILILLSTAFFRLYRLDFPDKYVFDEVYHAFTAKEYLLGHKEAWEWWTKPPPNVAYEWTHPPLAKEIMAASMLITRTTNAWAWRLPGALFGILSVYLVYLLGIKLTKKESAALISAYVFSIDGLNFVQSRTGMNDIYYVTFVLFSILFIINRKFFLSAVFFGLGISSKWAAIYLLLFYLILLLYNIASQKGKIFTSHSWRIIHLPWSFKEIVKVVCYFIFIPPAIYLLSYLPFFMLGHPFYQFIQLHQQMWWYHTNLKATHAYASPWWSWPLNLYPVWYFVDYQKNNVANIFASGNPIVFWVGFITAIITIIEFIKKRTKYLLIILIGCIAFWLPWALSPRIMFLYHYSPTVPFISLALGQQLSLELEDSRRKKLVFLLLILMGISFIFLLPFLTGIPIPRKMINLFFMTNLSKNPF